MARTKAAPQVIIRSDDVGIEHDSDKYLAPPELNLPYQLGDIELVKDDGSNEAYKAFHREKREAILRKAIKFGNELITIQIEEDDDPDSPIFVQSGHQGDTQYIWRGRPQTMKRKYVCSFLAGKRVSVSASYKPQSGSDPINTLNSSVKGTYRVSLVEDKNPEGGMRWFHSVLSAPA